MLETSCSSRGALMRRLESGAGCGACGRGYANLELGRLRDSARWPIRAGREELADDRGWNISAKARPGAGHRLERDDSHRRDGAPGGARLIRAAHAARRGTVRWRLSALRPLARMQGHNAKTANPEPQIIRAAERWL